MTAHPKYTFLMDPNEYADEARVHYWALDVTEAIQKGQITYEDLSPRQQAEYDDWYEVNHDLID